MLPTSVPTVAEIEVRLNLAYCPVTPVTLNTAYGDASLTATEVIANTRSSFGKVDALALSTTPDTGVGAVSVAGVMSVGFPEVYCTPEPSS